MPKQKKPKKESAKPKASAPIEPAAAKTVDKPKKTCSDHFSGNKW